MNTLQFHVSSKQAGGQMEEQIIDYNEANFKNILKANVRMVSKCTYVLYERYKCVMDMSEAHQEVVICLWNCVKHYNPKKFKFSTYFMCSFNNLLKRYYYSNFDAIKIAQEQTADYVNTDGEIINCGVCNSDEQKFVYYDVNMKIRALLSEPSKKVFDVFMTNYRFNPWLVSQRCEVSRQEGRHMYKNFLTECAILLRDQYIII